MARSLNERRRKSVVWISYPDRTVNVPRGWSVLEASRSFGIPHQALCGGRARCTTCRVRVIEGVSHCPDPQVDEARALHRLAATKGTIRPARASCVPVGNVEVVPILSGARARDGPRYSRHPVRRSSRRSCFCWMPGSTPARSRRARPRMTRSMRSATFKPSRKQQRSRAPKSSGTQRRAGSSCSAAATTRGRLRLARCRCLAGSTPMRPACATNSPGTWDCTQARRWPCTAAGSWSGPSAPRRWRSSADRSRMLERIRSRTDSREARQLPEGLQERCQRGRYFAGRCPCLGSGSAWGEWRKIIARRSVGRNSPAWIIDTWKKQLTALNPQTRSMVLDVPGFDHVHR